MTDPARQTDLTNFLSRRMEERLGEPRCTKRSAARLTIGDAIAEGRLDRGSLLPSEQRLTEILNVSLGTVQAALNQLQQTGVITRRRGDGTRVASTEPLDHDIWHFRLRCRTAGKPIHMVRASVQIDKAALNGPWRDFLGEAPSFLRIRRRLHMDNGTCVTAIMVLREALVPGLANIAPSELELVNVRPYLAKRYGLAIARAEHDIELCTGDSFECATFGFAPGTPIFGITARVFAPDGQPVYYQRILAPADEIDLSF